METEKKEEMVTEEFDRRDECVEKYLLAPSIYRFKFTEEFMKDMWIFSKIHQYDHRKDFKEAWALWLKENEEIVSQEIVRLQDLRYEGDILDKMFKSARYYFRKKSTEKKAPMKRREYIGMNRELIEKMDDHIERHVVDDDFKPSAAFDAFCEETVVLLKEEVSRLFASGLKDPDEIKHKIKKTYKNRYFMFINKLNNKGIEQS